MKTQVSEDKNREGMYWSFLIERGDISGGLNNVPVLNKCPFSEQIKKYIEDIFRRAINVVVDEMKIRNYSKIEGALFSIYERFKDSGNIPSIKDIEVFGEEKGLRVLIDLGEGYATDYQWNMYNDYINTVQERYKALGTDGFSTLVKEITNKYIAAIDHIPLDK